MPQRTFRLMALPSGVLAALLATSFSSFFLSAHASNASETEIQLEEAQFSISVEATSLRQILRRIFRDDEQKEPPTISRGDFCLLAPARPGQESAIWHQNPIVIWHGNIGRLEIVDDATNDILWSYQPTVPEETHARYAGEPLRSGRTYNVRVYQTSEATSPIAFPPFELLPTVNRRLIANGLAAAEQTLGNVDDSREAARAQYFVSRNLPVDALQALFATENPPESLIEARQDINQSLCPPR